MLPECKQRLDGYEYLNTQFLECCWYGRSLLCAVLYLYIGSKQCAAGLQVMFYDSATANVQHLYISCSTFNWSMQAPH